MPLLVERFYPYVAATIAVLVAARCARYIPGFYVVPKDAFTGMLNVSAIAVGFLATMKALIVSMEGRRVIRALRGSGYYDKMMGYIDGGILLSFLLLGACVPGLFVEIRVAGWALYYMCAFLWVAVAAGLACYRVTGVIAVVIAAPEAPIKAERSSDADTHGTDRR